jgi:hypothetical protein
MRVKEEEGEGEREEGMEGGREANKSRKPKTFGN